MTVSVTTTVQQYTGTGLETELNTVFPFFVSSDIVVTQRVTATGVDTTMVLGTHYTVEGGSAAGATGTVTPVAGDVDFTTLMTWTLRRSLPLTQGLDYVENDSFPAESHEAGLDRLTLQSQDRSAIIDRSIRFAEADITALTSELPSAVARRNKALTFDGDGNVTVTDPASASGTTVTATGSTTARTLQDRFAEVYNVKDFGAVGNGVADDTIAINAAITQANSDGGGIVQLPPGTYILGAPSSTEAVVVKSNVWLRGSGIGATKLKLKDAADAHMLNLATGSNTNIAISDMELDGNRATQTLGIHGVRLDGGTSEVRIFNLYIHDTYHYGIGLEDSTVGFSRIFIDSVHIKDVGGDGIDIKNPNNDNEQIFLSNITVDNWGLSFLINDPDDPTEPLHSAQAAFDLRGVVSLTNVQCINNDVASRIIGVTTHKPANAGIRFRTGVAGSATAENAAKRSTVSNFYIDGTSETARGLSLGGVHCVVTNGVIRLTGDESKSISFDATAVDENSHSNIVSHVTVLDSGYQGVSFSNDSSRNVVENCKFVNTVSRCVSHDGTDNVVQGCEFHSCAGHSVAVGATSVRAVYHSNLFRESVGEGIQVLSGAVDTVIRGNTYEGTGNSQANVSDAGTSTKMLGDVEFAITGTRNEHSVAGIPITIASATTLTIPYPAEYVKVTGTATSTSISATNSFAGRIVTLHFTEAANVNHAGNIKLAGGVPFTTIAADTTLTLACDGTNWVEISRSINSS